MSAAPEIPSEQNAVDLVYFMEATGFGIKIGFSNNPARRLLEIRSHCPFAVRLLFAIAGGVEREQALHREFSGDRIRGEWFRASQRLLTRISEIRASEPHYSFPSPAEDEMRLRDGPVLRVIAKCGKGEFSRGIDVIAQWTGKHRSNVYRWAQRGLIPTDEQQTILHNAQRLGLPLTPDDFFYRAEELVQRAEAVSP